VSVEEIYGEGIETSLFLLECLTAWSVNLGNLNPIVRVALSRWYSSAQKSTRTSAASRTS
jgi:hypothetical protein